MEFAVKYVESYAQAKPMAATAAIFFSKYCMENLPLTIQHFSHLCPPILLSSCNYFCDACHEEHASLAFCWHLVVSYWMSVCPSAYHDIRRSGPDDYTFISFPSIDTL